MNPTLNALFDEPEKRYLQADELNLLSQYVASLPERVVVYRRLRDEEVSLMQQVADTLEGQFPGETPEKLTRTVQNGLLVMRYSAMAMLMDDDSLVTKRLQSWLPDMVAAYETQTLELALYDLIEQTLGQRLTPTQMGFFRPGLGAARALVKGLGGGATAPTSGGAEDLSSATLLDIF